jgi:hypothetical protein
MHAKSFPPFFDRMLPPMSVCAGAVAFFYLLVLSELSQAWTVILAGDFHLHCNGFGLFLCSSAHT